MFRHIVLLRWSEPPTPERREEITAALLAMARSLPGTVAYHAGPDVVRVSGTPDEGRFDYALVGDFADRDAWAAYDVHPEHQRIRAEMIGPILESRAMVQFEF